MTVTASAIRGKIGRTEYYMAKISARDLGGIVVPASELEEWSNLSISERIQREVSLRRIRQELAPYLVQSNDRFYGSLIVTVMDADTFEFESISDLVSDLPAAYRAEFGDMGTLSIGGGKLVALDGQHRLVALREIVAGRMDVEGEFKDSVSDDEVCVLFIQHESLIRTRRIFNKVNRHARPTSPSDNIITSEDDGYAIVARWLTEFDPPLSLKGPQPPLALQDDRGELLIEWQKTTLSAADNKLTTLSTVYQTVQAILDHHNLRDFDEKSRVNRPENHELEQAYVWAAEWWSVVLSDLKAFKTAVERPEWIRDLRGYHEQWSLLFRPITQVALFRGLGYAVEAGMTLEEAVNRANRVRWRASHVMWVDVIIRANGRMLKSQKEINLAGRLIAYLIAADLLDGPFIQKLAADYQEAKGLPFYGATAEDLPRPVE